MRRLGNKNHKNELIIQNFERMWVHWQCTCQERHVYICLPKHRTLWTQRPKNNMYPINPPHPRLLCQQCSPEKPWIFQLFQLWSMPMNHNRQSWFRYTYSFCASSLLAIWTEIDVNVAQMYHVINGSKIKLWRSIVKLFCSPRTRPVDNVALDLDLLLPALNLDRSCCPSSWSRRSIRSSAEKKMNSWELLSRGFLFRRDVFNHGSKFWWSREKSRTIPSKNESGAARNQGRFSESIKIVTFSEHEAKKASRHSRWAKVILRPFRVVSQAQTVRNKTQNSSSWMNRSRSSPFFIWEWWNGRETQRIIETETDIDIIWSSRYHRKDIIFSALRIHGMSSRGRNGMSSFWSPRNIYPVS